MPACALQRGGVGFYPTPARRSCIWTSAASATGRACRRHSSPASWRRARSPPSLRRRSRSPARPSGARAPCATRTRMPRSSPGRRRRARVTASVAPEITASCGRADAEIASHDDAGTRGRRIQSGLRLLPAGAGARTAAGSLGGSVVRLRISPRCPRSRCARRSRRTWFRSRPLSANDIINQRGYWQGWTRPSGRCRPPTFPRPGTAAPWSRRSPAASPKAAWRRGRCRIARPAATRSPTPRPRRPTRRAAEGPQRRPAPPAPQREAAPQAGRAGRRRPASRSASASTIPGCAR